VADDGEPPLGGMRVVDLATVLAGPGCARYLADFGAEVIKVERPGSPDSIRAMGPRHPDDDVTYFWKLVSRNKRMLAADLRDPADLALVRALIDDADVLVENFRPGKLEALGLVPDELIASNPRLVITRVSGFGQDGPYANRPGFATLAEAMSGYASLTGEVDGAPLLPPIALTDEVTALVAAFATMVAVHGGGGQVVDVNLLESLVQLMGPLVSAAVVDGFDQPRLGSGIAYTVPRGTYQCFDGGWVAISTSSESVATRVMALVGADDERFATFDGRVAHRQEVDALVAAWIAERTLDQVLAAFAEAEAAAAAVYTVGDLVADEHVLARGVVADVGDTPMQGLIARLSRTPGALRWPGRPMDADGDAIRATGWT